MIVGAGAAGRTLAKALLDAEGVLAPVGFIDDDPPGDTVSGLPVLGGTADIAATVWPVRAHVAVVAIPSLPPARIAELIERVAAAGLDVRYVPPGGDPRAPLRLLGRDELKV
ncbi:MAG: nucleoside-diphosphate sugar epimerase/dehydratase, partial [Actinoallomurus sp.]